MALAPALQTVLAPVDRPAIVVLLFHEVKHPLVLALARTFGVELGGGGGP